MKGKFVNVTKDCFCKDGIIDEQRYVKASKKVLFICNEANIDKHIPSKPYARRGDRCQEFLTYGEQKYDEWSGKMRERICSLYKVIINDYSNDKNPYDVASEFAFMNINKAGGGAEVNDNHIVEYCLEFKDEIEKEIVLIEPEIIVWIGIKTYEQIVEHQILNTELYDGKWFYKIGDNRIPIIKMWHTSYFQAEIQIDKGFEGKFKNRTIRKLATKLKQELEKYQ